MNVLVIKEKDRKTFLLDKQIKLSIADNYAGGIFSESAERLVSSLLQSKANKDIDISQVRLAVSQKLFEFYRLFLGHNGKDITKTPDYNYRAEILSKLTSLSELEIIKGFTKFSDEEIKTALEGQKMSLYAEIDGMCRLSKSINDINVALGGDTNVLDNFAPIDVGYAIYSASDFPNTFSLLTLIRDIGMLEYIG